jgi:hypothetical protein
MDPNSFRDIYSSLWSVWCTQFRLESNSLLRGDSSGVERKEYDYLIHLKGFRNFVECSISYFFQIQLSWHYFAIRHGKGVVNGIGGSVKYLVYRPILIGKECTSTADFVRIAPSKTNTIELNEVEQYPIDNSKQQFEKSSC